MRIFLGHVKPFDPLRSEATQNQLLTEVDLTQQWYLNLHRVWRLQEQTPKIIQKKQNTQSHTENGLGTEMPKKCFRCGQTGHPLKKCCFFFNN